MAERIAAVLRDAGYQAEAREDPGETVVQKFVEIEVN